MRCEPRGEFILDIGEDFTAGRDRDLFDLPLDLPLPLAVVVEIEGGVVIPVKLSAFERPDGLNVKTSRK